MPMGMPYPKGDMKMGSSKSMSELMGVEKKGYMKPEKPMPKAAKKAKAKMMNFKKK